MENFPEAVIIPKYIKKTLKFKEADVLHINITYPNFSVKSNPKTEKKINSFYDVSVRSFMDFCEKNLYKSAAAEFLRNPSDFKPFGAVIKFETVCSRREFLCVYLDINIYSGEGRGNVTRKAQIWDLQNGDLYSPKRMRKLTPNEN